MPLITLHPKISSFHYSIASYFKSSECPTKQFMAILLPNIAFSLHAPCYKKALATSIFGRKAPLLQLGKRQFAIKMNSKALPKLDDPLSSITEEKKREQNEVIVEQEYGLGLSKLWRLIHGQDDWVGMLDPMNPLLRTELIRYGDMAQACYDAFDHDPYSKYYGSSKYNRRKFFESLGMSDLGYDVTRYLYATSNIKSPNFFKKSKWNKMWSENANWIGYVAVSGDEASKRIGRRDITVAWRGTVTQLEWVADLQDFLRPISSDKIPCPDPCVKVESGFLDLYTDKDENQSFCKYSAREQILFEVRKLIAQYSNEELSITVTGHSLGSAVAILNAFDMAETGTNMTTDGRTVPISVFSFSGPRVGNRRFRERLEELGVKVLRIVNVHDVVPKVPGIVINENVPVFFQKIVDGLPWSYSHVGVELELDHRNSPFLKETIDPVRSHNLEALLHLLDGYHGKGQRFVGSGRDPALVNKSSDFLKEHYLVPPSWRQEENKGMVRNEEGRWVLPERPHVEKDCSPEMHQKGWLGN